jgi:hypothetical protein
MAHRVVKYHPKLITVTSSRISHSPRAEEEAGELAAGAAGAGDPGAGTGEKYEDRRAVVGDPASGEQRQVGAGQVGGVEPGLGEVGPDVIQHHDDHD